jgi:predicted GIY-YIG superfamily endonuclease
MGSPYYIYVIQSQQVRVGKRGNPLPGYFYVGMTTDPIRRLREHNGLYANGEPGNPKGSKWTSKHRPHLLMAIHGPYETRSDALKAEHALKRGKRGIARCRWTPEDSPWCRGEGVDDPRIAEANEWIAPHLHKVKSISTTPRRGSSRRRSSRRRRRSSSGRGTGA